MNEFTRLTRPEQSQVSIDSTPKECPSDGFNYPTFRLLNKQGRVILSTNPLNPQQFNRLFAIANSKAWFAAVTFDSIQFSPLSDLRLAFNSTNSQFSPSRSLPLTLGATPTHIAFACADARLIVAFDAGQLAIYDTSVLFSPGSGNIQPLHVLETHSGPFRQIAPNPGTESGIADSLAVVRADGCVQLLNTNLESQGGWAGSNVESTPVAVAWSPKGKHLAVGLHSGDILTFLPSSPSSPQKHIPHITSAPLVSLTWLSPGHTFRTSYAPAPQSVDPVQHLVSLDTKTSSLTYAAPNHPFSLPDRTQQAFVVVLPRWDEDNSTSEKNLLVVADRSSTDIEILGSSSTGWHQQWQENQLALPLDKLTSEDTILLALDVDLTNPDGVPVMYAYLNDGTVEGWFIDGAKPYVGMVNPAAPAVVASPFTQPQPTPFAASTAPAFPQPASSSVFGQSGFSTSNGNTSGFGSTGFSQPPAFSAFNNQSSQPAFGQSSQPTSGFGAFASSSPSAFGGASRAFGSTPSAFGSITNNAFGTGTFNTSSTPSAFGKPSAAFNSFPASNPSPFGQLGFGFGTNATPSASPPPSDMPREASMGDDTSFGGLSLSLGDDDANSSTASNEAQQKNSIFGPFTTSVAPTTTTTFGGCAGGGLLKPATGFGVLGSFGSSGTGSTANTGVGTEQKRSAFGHSGFGQSGFGQSGFGTKPSVSSPASTNGGDGAFAAGGATGFGTGSGGFSAFSSGTFSAFGQQQQQKQSGLSAFASSSLASSASTPSPSPLGTQPQLTSSSFREAPPPAKEELSPQTPTKPLDTISPSPSSSPDTTTTPSSPFGRATTPEPKIGITPSPSPFGPKHGGTGGGAFGNLTTTPSAFKPASGFGAFGSDTTSTSSPFFKPKPSEAQSPAPGPVSVFLTPSTPTQASTFSTSTATTTPTTLTTTPAFGAPSSLGAFKSVFATMPPPTAVKAPTTGGFGAFSGTTGGFGAFAGQKKSFGGLLKDGGEKGGEEEDPVKPSTSVFGGAKEKVEQKVEEKVKQEEEEKEKETETETETEVKRKSDGKVGEASKETVEPVKSEGVKSLEGTETTVKAKSSTPLESDPMSASEDKPAKGLFASKIPVSTLPPSTLSKISDDGTPTPQGKAKEEVISPNTTPKAPVAVFSPPPQSTSSEAESGQDKGVEMQELSSMISEDTSFGNISMLSEASSFVKVKEEEGEEEESGEGDEEESPSSSDTDGERVLELEDDSSDGSSFLSESYGSSDESPDEEEGSEGKEDGAYSPGPTAIPLPASRSPSATPQPETPTIQVTPSPTDSPEPGVLPTIPEEESTTPPGTPAKEHPPLRKSPSPVPNSTSVPLFGLGRPSTRPTRSSPLASTPVSVEDNEEQVPTPAPEVPSSPKPRFAVLPMPPPSPDKAEVEDSRKKPVSKLPPRPKTPPLLSFGTSKPSAASSTPAVAVSPLTLPANTPNAPSAAAPFSTFGRPGILQSATSQTQGTPTKSPAPTPSPGLPFPPPITAAASPSSGIFGTLPGTAPTPQQMLPATGLGPSPFGLKGAINMPATQTCECTLPPSMNGIFSNLSPKAASALVPASPAILPAAVNQVQSVTTMEEGMQKECALLFLAMNKELEELRLLVQRASEKRLELGTFVGGSRKKADLGDNTKWNLGDVVQFGQVLLQYEDDLVTLKALRDAQHRALRDLQSNMLKAGTRREEMSRFKKAKNDSEFAKMLKSRTLGPEHLEMQTQLRRDIRIMRDRIQKLEDHLKVSKKKLNQVNSGKLGFRAPTLDTINRTYRNIHIAIQQQADEVAQLSSRISKLTIKNPGALKSQHSARDPRLPDAVVSRRPYNVTPHVAVTTAAALNAERSAHGLKRALLAARKEPLLNTKAATARTPPSGFRSPQQALSPPTVDAGFPSSNKRHLFADPDTHSTPVPVSNWTLPEDNFNPSTPPAARRGAGVGKRQHMSVPLKKTGATASPPATTFEWGPLPVFEQAQGTTMVEAVKLTPPSAGWNTGLFRKKGT